MQGRGLEINYKTFKCLSMILLKCSCVQMFSFSNICCQKLSVLLQVSEGVRDCINSRGPLTQFPPKAHLMFSLHETSKILLKCCPCESVCFRLKRANLLSSSLEKRFSAHTLNIYKKSDKTFFPHHPPVISQSL